MGLCSNSYWRKIYRKYSLEDTFNRMNLVLNKKPTPLYKASSDLHTFRVAAAEGKAVVSGGIDRWC